MEALQAYWKGHSNLVNVHHEHEDTMFTPMLKEKVNYPEKLEADHDALVKMMAGVDSAVAALAAGGASPRSSRCSIPTARPWRRT